MLHPQYIEEFKNEMNEAGLICHDEILADGLLHRFKPDADTEPNGWYVLHADLPVCGAFGCWKRQIRGRWHMRARLQHSEHLQLLERIQEARRHREEKAEERFAKTQLEMKAALAEATADPEHLQTQAYLQRKSVQAFGELYRHRDDLLIPLRSMEGELRCVQRIRPDGTKLFWEGSKPSGAFFSIPGPDYRGVLICEGYATGASIHAATGFETLCAMNCGSLDDVAQIARLRWPARRILICADDDRWGRKPNLNPGFQAAEEAADLVNGFWILPKFRPHPSRPTDFNDLQMLEGVMEVRRQIIGFMKKVLSGQNPNDPHRKKPARQVLVKPTPGGVMLPKRAAEPPDVQGTSGLRQPCPTVPVGGRRSQGNSACHQAFPHKITGIDGIGGMGASRVEADP